MSNVATILAAGGAILSMIANVPQVWKVRSLHTTGDLHVYTIILHLTAAVVWSVYGNILELYILSVESAIVGGLNILLLFAIVRDRCIFPKTIDTVV
jgi:uncharacterized protein with PQ loop repeat